MVKVDVAKNRVQLPNSPQAKSFFSRAMMGCELVAVPDFSLRYKGCSKLE